MKSLANCKRTLKQKAIEVPRSSLQAFKIRGEQGYTEPFLNDLKIAFDELVTSLYRGTSVRFVLGDDELYDQYLVKGEILREGVKYILICHLHRSPSTREREYLVINNFSLLPHVPFIRFDEVTLFFLMIENFGIDLTLQYSRMRGKFFIKENVEKWFCYPCYDISELEGYMVSSRQIPKDDYHEFHWIYGFSFKNYLQELRRDFKGIKLMLT